jgi:hypothetical protein
MAPAIMTSLMTAGFMWRVRRVLLSVMVFSAEQDGWVADDALVDAVVLVLEANLCCSGWGMFPWG